MPFVNITGPIIANSIYVSGELVARDVAITFPEVAPITADVQATGTMSLPIWQLLEDMEMSITKIGVDMKLSKMLMAENLNLEIRWAHTDTDAGANTNTVGCKAFLKVIPKVIPGAELAIGEPTENEVTYTVTRYQVFVDGAEAWLVDRLSGIVRINGKDYTSGVNSLL